MGIDTAIRELIKQKVPTSFYDSSVELLNDVVVIDDVLTRMRRFGGSSSRDFTGLELFNVFYTIVKHYMNSGAAAYVLICDDNANIPHQKLSTQNRRNDGSGAAPYIGNYIIVEKGIYNTDIDLYGNHPELINVERLMITRALRIKLWQFFNVRLMDTEQYSLREGFRVIFEYEKKKVNLYPDSYGWQQSWRAPHNLGEADTSLVYWAEKFQSYPTIILTIDTDTLPITLNYMERSGYARGPSAPLYWMYQKYKSDKYAYFDMIELYNKLWLPASTFCLGCVMAGNDFFTKSTIARSFNCELMLQAVKDAEHAGFLMNDWRDARSASMAVVATLALLYGTRYNYERLSALTQDNLLDEWLEIGKHAYRQNDKLVIPDDAAITAAVKRIAWNMRYWN